MNTLHTTSTYIITKGTTESTIQQDDKINIRHLKIYTLETIIHTSHNTFIKTTTESSLHHKQHHYNIIQPKATTITYNHCSSGIEQGICTVNVHEHINVFAPMYYTK